MDTNFTTSTPTNKLRSEIVSYLANVNFIMAFVQGFICVVGVLGNMLALIVINRKSLRNTSSAVFITYMAIFDSAVLLVHAANLIKLRGYPLLHCSLAYLLDLSTFCANWVLVILTLERCVAVHSPFLAKRFCTVAYARYSMYSLLAFAIVFFSIIFPFTYQMVGKGNMAKCFLRHNGGKIIRIYQGILFYAIPDLLLLSNLFTVRALCRRRQRLSCAGINDMQKSESRISDINSNRKQRQLTIMLVTISLSFYLFTTPATIAYFAQRNPPTTREPRRLKQNFLLQQITVVLLQLNNATNFIFYCFAGQRFRRTTWQTVYEYSAKLNTFYQRYILCNKQYTAAPVCVYHSYNMHNTTMTNRGSVSPHQHLRNERRYRRTSTV